MFCDCGEEYQDISHTCAECSQCGSSIACYDGHEYNGGSYVHSGTYCTQECDCGDEWRNLENCWDGPTENNGETTYVCIYCGIYQNDIPCYGGTHEYTADISEACGTVYCDCGTESQEVGHDFEGPIEHNGEKTSVCTKCGVYANDL